MFLTFVGLCGRVYGIKDILLECLHDVQCGCAPVRSDVPVLGEKDVQVSLIVIHTSNLRSQVRSCVRSASCQD